MIELVLISNYGKPDVCMINWMYNHTGGSDNTLLCPRELLHSLLPVSFREMAASGWEVRFSKSRQLPYFFKPQTSESIWEPPTGLTTQQLAELPGAKEFLTIGQAQQAGTTNVGNGGGAGGGGGKTGEVRASHILCKHVGSRRASSWREVSVHSITVNLC